MNRERGVPRRWALLTGATGALGREIACLLAERGYSLLLVARRKNVLETLAEEIRARLGHEGDSEDGGVAVVPVSADLTDIETVFSTIETALAAHDAGPSDISLLVNNAGNASFGPVAGEDPRRMSAAIHLNVEAPARLARWIIPTMQPGSVICNIASVAAFTPGPLMASYYAAKAWLLSFGEALHEELRDKGIAVVTCCPGPFESDFHATAGIDPQRVTGAETARSVAEGVMRAITARRPVAPIGFAARLWAIIGPRLPRSWSRRIIGRLQRRRRSS